MKCGPLGKLHYAHGWEQVSVLNWLFCSHCIADSNCSPDANCLHCPGSMGCCKVLVSWSSSLQDMSKLHELPHTSSIALIYLCVCAAIRLLYQKILKVLLQLFPVCFLLLVNVSGIYLSSWLCLEAPGFCLMILVLSWCPECLARMRALLQPALCKHNAEPTLKNLAVLVSEPVRLNHLGMYLREAHYRWACYRENNTVVTVSSTLLGRQMCCWSAVMFDCCFPSQKSSFHRCVFC